MSRSKWKGPYVATLKENKSVLNYRKIEITPYHVGQIYKIKLFNSKKSILNIKPTSDMIGIKFGQFSPTRSVFVYKKKKKKKK